MNDQNLSKLIEGQGPIKDQNLSRLKEEVGKVIDAVLSWLKKAARLAGLTLAVVGSAAALAALNLLGVGYAWLFIAPAFGVAFYLLAPRHPRLARVAKSLFPVVNELINRQEQVNSNIVVVEKMGYTLRFYELGNIDDDEAFYNRLINSLPDINADDQRIKNCARNAAEKVAVSRAYVTGDLIELLYRERHGTATGFWDSEKERLSPGLAMLLLENERLRKKRGEVAYHKDDLTRLLEALEDYAFDKLEEQVDSLNQIYGCANDYLSFLARHDLAHQMTLEGVKSVLAYVKNKLPLAPDDVDLTTRAVLIPIGQQAVGAVLPASADAALVEGFCLVSLALFLADRPEMLKVVCQEIGKNEAAIQLTFAYLEFKVDLRIEGRLAGHEFVSIAYLMQNWERRVEERKKDLPGFTKEINLIRETCGRGDWVTSLSYVLEKTYETILATAPLITEIHARVTHWGFIQESLQRVFRTLSLATVERYLETRRINAYLLTFRSAGGTVSGLLDSLVSPEKRALFDGVKIPLRDADLAKYNFQQYTNHARIGVVPRGWDLERFYRAFQEDFEKVIDSREALVPSNEWNWEKSELKDIELIVHRFGLSGRNYYGFVSEEFARYYTLEKIKELFSGILSSKDLLAVIGYEMDGKDLLRAIMEGPMTELIGDQLSDEEKAVFEARKDSLRMGILEACGFKRAAIFGFALKRDAELARESRAKAAAKLAELLSTVPPIAAPPAAEAERRGRRTRRQPQPHPPLPEIEFDENRCRVIVNVYIDTLIALASIG